MTDTHTGPREVVQLSAFGDHKTIRLEDPKPVESPSDFAPRLTSRVIYSATRVGRDGIKQSRASGNLNSRSSEVDDYVNPARPKTRADCESGLRPCPWVSCPHHLAFDVSKRTGSITCRRATVADNPTPTDWMEFPVSCVLDVADASDGLTLEEVAELMNLTKERVRQIEASAFRKIVGLGGIDRFMSDDDDDGGE